MEIVRDPVWIAGPDTSEFDHASDAAEDADWEEIWELMNDKEKAYLDDFVWICEKLEAYMGDKAKTWKDIDGYLLQVVREMVGIETLTERIIYQRREG